MKRRRILMGLGAGWASTILPGSFPALGLAQSYECGALTPTDAEGPFYRAGAPETRTLNADGRLMVSGRVLSATCGPAHNAVIEVWQANAEGEYDLQGYRHRGVVRCAEDGSFAFRTVRPGHYLNGRRYRPAHIHVKVHADGRPTLTTQLYFRGDRYNESDPWFRESLLLTHQAQGCRPGRGMQRVRFDFVV